MTLNNHEIAMVGLIYEALEDPACWTRFLEHFVVAIRAKQATFWLTHSQHWDISFSASTGIPKEVLSTYQEKWKDQDPYVSHVNLSEQPVGVIVPSHELCPDDILEQTAVYRHFFHALDWHYGGGVLIDFQPTMAALMSTLRSKSVGPLNQEEIGLWQRLVPHLQRAVRLHGERAVVRAERDALLRYFDDTDAGLLLANRVGTVLLSNGPGRSTLSQGNGLYLSPDGRLKALHPDDDILLSQAIARFATPHNHRVDTCKIAVRRGKGNAPLLVVLSPAGREVTVNISAREPAVLIYVFDPQIPMEFDPAALQSLFALTPAEAGFACRLGEGATVEEAAKALFVSVNTARTHLKRILQKTNTRRQSELVALVLRVARK